MPVQRNITTHFSRNPVTIDKSRSTFDRSCNLLTSFRVGDLIPLYLDQDILPGDTVKFSTTSLLRMMTPIFPVMDNAYFDYFAFFVPKRLVWSSWEAFMGEADPAAYTSPTIPTFPTVTVTPTNRNLPGYFGLPYGKQATVSALPFRAYRMIWNFWFRNQNTQDYLTISKASGTDVNDYTAIQKVNKFADPFTSALPATQKGAAVDVMSTLTAPVKSAANYYNYNASPVQFSAEYGYTKENAELLAAFSPISGSANSAALDHMVDTDTDNPDTVSLGGPTNLYAQLPAISVNALRLAVQTQRLLELDARGGSLYQQLIFSHFGVKSLDSRMQRPEYLGGGHVTVNMMQVLQNSANADEPTPIGTVSAYSKTLHSKFDFERSFTEHGILMVVGCVRTALSYQQGIGPEWFRFSRYQNYYPTLANVGEQPVLNKYLYYQNDSTPDNQVFGYQEAWWEYRTNLSKVTGQLNSGYTYPLDAWHYAEFFGSKPTLSDAFSQQGRSAFFRSMAVQSDTDADDFVANFYFQIYHTRIMPTYSIPGLLDHF